MKVMWVSFSLCGSQTNCEPNIGFLFLAFIFFSIREGENTLKFIMRCSKFSFFLNITAVYGSTAANCMNFK